MTLEYPTAPEVWALHLKHEIGLIDARRIILQERMTDIVRRAETVDDLKPVLIELIAHYK